MTPAQAKVYKTFLSLRGKVGITPSYKRIAGKLGLRSLATVHKHIHALIKAGHLRAEPAGSRNLVPVKTLAAELLVEAQQLRSELSSQREHSFLFERELGHRVGDAVSVVREEYQEKLAFLDAELRTKERTIQTLTSELERVRQEVDNLKRLSGRSRPRGG